MREQGHCLLPGACRGVSASCNQALDCISCDYGSWNFSRAWMPHPSAGPCLVVHDQAAACSRLGMLHDSDPRGRDSQPFCLQQGFARRLSSRAETSHALFRAGSSSPYQIWTWQTNKTWSGSFRWV